MSQEPPQTEAEETKEPAKEAPKLREDKMTLFTCYAERPKGLRFETQHEEEQVVLFMRQHFIVNVPWIAATILLLIAPFTILPFFFSLVPFPIDLPPAFGTIGLGFWYLATFGYVLSNFMRWYYNMYIVTTMRIIDIDFIQLMYKKFSETNLNRIEDTNYAMAGFWATFFNFGHVYIQTASEVNQFEFTSIPNPAQAVKIIGELVKNENQQ